MPIHPIRAVPLGTRICVWRPPKGEPPAPSTGPGPRLRTGIRTRGFDADDDCRTSLAAIAADGLLTAQDVVPIPVESLAPCTGMTTVIAGPDVRRRAASSTPTTVGLSRLFPAPRPQGADSSAAATREAAALAARTLHNRQAASTNTRVPGRHATAAPPVPPVSGVRIPGRLAATGLRWCCSERSDGVPDGAGFRHIAAHAQPWADSCSRR